MARTLDLILMAPEGAGQWEKVTDFMSWRRKFYKNERLPWGSCSGLSFPQRRSRQRPDCVSPAMLTLKRYWATSPRAKQRVRALLLTKSPATPRLPQSPREKLPVAPQLDFCWERRGGVWIGDLSASPA